MNSSVKHFKILLALAFLCMAGAYNANATHLRAGEITVVRENCNSLTFTITVTVYTNTGSSVLFGGRVGEEDILERSEEHTSELQSRENLVCRLLLEK